jgi:pyruvate dehydrogenase E2 component (dihydrolipoamide acetyltransferase)
MEHGIIMGWSKKEGDSVSRGDILFQVESDKAIVDVESDYEGILLKRYHDEGDDVPCGEIVAIIGQAGETFSYSASTTLEASVKEEKRPEPIPGSGTKIVASPRAKRLALKENVDIALVGQGSGDKGRIKEKDIVSYIEKRFSSDDKKISPVAKNILEANHASSGDLQGSGPEGRIMKRDVLVSLSATQADTNLLDSGKPFIIPLSAMRETIARRLSESKSTIPHYYITVAVDMTNFLESRKVWNTANPDKKVSMNAMILKIVASALKKNPMINASWSKEGILVYPTANIALAVSTDKGLVTPVVRNCGHKSVVEIEAEVSDLIARARSGQLKFEEFSGSTCTISNLGMYGVEEFSAIINPPEASILAIASIIDTPVAQDKAVVVRPIMRITMSADHRVIDGAASAAFLGDLRAMMEHPFLALF